MVGSALDRSARYFVPGRGEAFRDCEFSPELVVVPAGRFVMGNDGPPRDDGYYLEERPAHTVMLASSFAVGRYPITFDEWDIFHDATGGGNRRLPAVSSG